MLRMIEQIAAMLAAILARKRAGQLVEAHAEIENSCLQTVGITMAELKRLSPEAVAQLLNNFGALRTIRAMTLAELLLVEAEIHEPDLIPQAILPKYVPCVLSTIADEVDKLTAEEQTIYRAKLAWFGRTFWAACERILIYRQGSTIWERPKIPEIRLAESLVNAAVDPMVAGLRPFYAAKVRNRGCCFIFTIHVPWSGND